MDDTVDVDDSEMERRLWMASTWDERSSRRRRKYLNKSAYEMRANKDGGNTNVVFSKNGAKMQKTFKRRRQPGNQGLRNNV